MLGGVIGVEYNANVFKVPNGCDATPKGGVADHSMP